MVPSFQCLPISALISLKPTTFFIPQTMTSPPRSIFFRNPPPCINQQLGRPNCSDRRLKSLYPENLLRVLLSQARLLPALDASLVLCKILQATPLSPPPLFPLWAPLTDSLSSRRFRQYAESWSLSFPPGRLCNAGPGAFSVFSVSRPSFPRLRGQGVILLFSAYPLGLFPWRCLA